jgi:hypothetical protein
MSINEMRKELPKLTRDAREQIIELGRERSVWISRPTRARVNLDDRDALLQATEVPIHGTGANYNPRRGKGDSKQTANQTQKTYKQK